MAYTPTTWSDGDVITAEKLNKLEQGVKNEQVGPAGPAGPAGPSRGKRRKRRKRRSGCAGTCWNKLHSSSGEQNNAGWCETDGFDCRFVDRNSD